MAKRAWKRPQNREQRLQRAGQTMLRHFLRYTAIHPEKDAHNIAIRKIIVAILDKQRPGEDEKVQQGYQEALPRPIMISRKLKPIHEDLVVSRLGQRKKLVTECYAFLREFERTEQFDLKSLRRLQSRLAMVIEAAQQARRSVRERVFSNPRRDIQRANLNALKLFDLDLQELRGLHSILNALPR